MEINSLDEIFLNPNKNSILIYQDTIAISEFNQDDESFHTYQVNLNQLKFALNNGFKLVNTQVENAQPKWTSLGFGLNLYPYDFTVLNNELYVVGDFTEAGGIPAQRAAKWNGLNWAALGSGLNAFAFTTLVFNNKIVAGGSFTQAGGSPANYIAEWDGTNWTELGGGVNGDVYNSIIYNNKLVLTGNFTSVSGGAISANYIAEWDGVNWTPLSNGVDTIPGGIAVYNNELYVGGSFFTVDGGAVSATGLAKWNGNNWSAVSGGIDISGLNFVSAMEVYNNNLVISGQFSSVSGGIPMNNITQWNGTNFLPLSSGLNGNLNSFTVINDKLYGGGSVSDYNYLIEWNGISFTGVGGGMNGVVYTVGLYNNHLIAGGNFSQAGDISVNYIAKY